MPLNAVPPPVQVALNPDPSPKGLDFTRVWRTVSDLLTRMQVQLFAVQTYVNTIASPVPASTVTDVAIAGAVGVGTPYARSDHAHRGISSVTGPAATSFGPVTFDGTALSQVGNVYTFTAGAAAAVVPTNILVISPGSGTIVFIAPVAIADFNGSMYVRAKHDLTNASQVRIVVVLKSPNPAPATVPNVVGQYSLDNGVTWNYLDGGTGPSVVYAAGMIVSAWVALAAPAKVDVLLRVATIAGDGVNTISFGSVYLQAK